MEFDDSMKTTHEEVVTLIELFKNKKSGKVIKSREKLRDCINYQNREDQILILRTFLNSIDTDTAWAIRKMQMRWYPELMPLVRKRWKTRPTKELGSFIIKNSSRRYVLSQKDLLIRTMGYYRYLVETAPWGEKKVALQVSSSFSEYYPSEYYRACFLYNIKIDKKAIAERLFLNILDYFCWRNHWFYDEPRILKMVGWEEAFNSTLYLEYFLRKADTELLIQTMRDLGMKREMKIFWEWKEKMLVSMQCHSSYKDHESFSKYVRSKVTENFPPQFFYLIVERYLRLHD